METFVVRVWTPAEGPDDGGPPVLRGFVEHVRAGERRRFDGGEALLAFVEHAVAAPIPHEQPKQRSDA